MNELWLASINYPDAIYLVSVCRCLLDTVSRHCLAGVFSFVRESCPEALDSSGLKRPEMSKWVPDGEAIKSGIKLLNALKIIWKQIGAKCKYGQIESGSFRLLASLMANFIVRVSLQGLYWKRFIERELHSENFMPWTQCPDSMS